MSIVFLLLLLLILIGLVVLLILFASRENRGNGEEIEQLREELRELKAEHARDARANREETARSVLEINRALHGQINEMNNSQIQQVSALTKNSDEAAERLRLTIDEKLTAIYLSNEKKLDEMRRTVDEKLENTLNQRIGESFGQVNERLEMVHKSLGEIQGLSANMTDIKKIFSNVKTRGVWGEVQLAQILEEILTPDQYAVNVSTGAKSEEKVEFAVCLPGRDETNGTVYLPIDSKFPAEDYGRLITAAENGDALSAAECRKGLERTLKNEAKMIRDKYINPPKTLDYAIMFLPTEGLYSEALRLPSFMEYAAEQRVMVTGPTNLAALLNSLKMGFRTLAIEEKSGEIRKLLAMVKTDMARFAASLEKAQKKIAEADKTIGEANHRTELITRRLKNVETGGEENSPADDEIQKNHQ